MISVKQFAMHFEVSYTNSMTFISKRYICKINDDSNVYSVDAHECDRLLLLVSTTNTVGGTWWRS